MRSRDLGRIVCMIAFPIVLGAAIIGFRGWRPSTHEGLTLLANAAKNYYAVHGEFPPATIHDQNDARMHSWRVLLVPFIEANTLYDAYDFSEPWNAPVNIGLAKKTNAANYPKHLPPAFVGEIYTQTRGKSSRDDFTTDFLLLSRARAERFAFRKVPTSDKTTLMSAVSSVPSELIIIQLDRTAIHWMEPRDLSLARTPNGGDMPWEYVRDSIQASARITNTHVSYFNRAETLEFLNSLE